MFREEMLTSVLNKVGYRRVDPYTYRADWSAMDVEHFIYFMLYGSPFDYLTADFGVRNQPAQTFAREEIRRYGGNLYQLMEVNGETRCSMSFSLGNVALWKPRSSLRVSSMSSQDLAIKIEADIEVRLFPLIRQITCTDRLLSFLLEDTESHSWLQSNGAIRAGMIVDLAVWYGVSEMELRFMLEPYHRMIARNLLGAPSPDPAAYVKNIVEDAIRKRRHAVN